MTHGDFVYVPESELRQQTPTVTGQEMAQKPLKPAEIARQAATLCWRISNEEPDPTKWKARIEAAPEELRECLREYLKQKYRAMQHKAKPKQSAAGDAALAALAKRYG